MANFSNLIESSRFALARDGQRRLQPLVILGALLFIVAIAYAGNSTLHLLLIVALVGLVGLMVLQRWPSLGIIVLVVSGMLLPYVGPAGLNASMGLAALMLALWLGDMLIVKRRIEFVSSRTVWPLLALIIVAILAFFSGQFLWFSFARNAPLDAQLGGLSLFVLSAGAFLLVAHQVRDIRWLQIMVWIFLLFGTFFLAGRAFPPLRPIMAKIIQPASIGGVFYAWFPALAYGQVLFNRHLRLPWRILLLALVALCVYVGYFLFFGWKSGWMPTLAAIGVITFLRNQKLGLAAIPIVVLLVLPMIPDLMASDDYSISTRMDAWLILAQIAKANPILGLGFGNYYWYTPLFNIRGYTVSFNSHNNYIDIIAQVGLLGMACFLWFFWEIGRVGWLIRERVPDGFAKGYVYGALGGLVATLVAAMLGDWLLSFVYNVGLAGYRTGVLAWLFLGGVVAIQSIYKIDLTPRKVMKSE